jgi:hypothetical protein
MHLRNYWQENDSVTKLSKPMIDLSYYHGLGLIIPFPSGVIYQNQADGLLCTHPQVEGVFVPLSVKSGVVELWALQQHFRGATVINQDSAEVVDSILRRYGHVYLKVNSTRLAESFEAWFHVVVDEAQRPELPLALPISGFGKCEGILTWPNSD